MPIDTRFRLALSSLVRPMYLVAFLPTVPMTKFFVEIEILTLKLSFASFFPFMPSPSARLSKSVFSERDTPQHSLHADR